MGVAVVHAARVQPSPPPTRRRSAGWRAFLGTAITVSLVVTTLSAGITAALSRDNGTIQRQLRSLGLSELDARRAASAVAHDLRLQMIWTAVFAIVLLIGWLPLRRHWLPEGRRARPLWSVVLASLAG